MEVELQLNHNSFESDIRALLMAFYAGCHIHVTEIASEETTIPQKTDAQTKAEETKRYAMDGERTLAVLTDGRFTTLRLYGEHPKCRKDSTDIAMRDAQPRLLGETRFEEPQEIADDRLRRKSLLKRELYTLLSADTGKSLPWGTLTGIRPTRLALSMLREGRGGQEIAAYMKEEYKTSDEKIRLAVEIAAREDALLRKINYKNGYSLYIGIPFCPSTCAYCSFTSYPLAMWETRTEEYLDALEKELDFISAYNRGRRLSSVYIGGGTPTTLKPKQLDRLCRMLTSRFPMDGLPEWSVEAGRPDSITKEKLAVFKNYPVTRISINPQTMKEETLKLIGRRHTAAQTAEAFALARSMGFENINMDIILGLPDETSADVKRTLDAIAAMEPDSLTVHALAKKRAARLTTQREAFADTVSVDTQQLHALVEKRARQMGLLPYYLYRQKNMAGNLENVGYAAEGKYGIYNILIMEEMQSIFGAGAGASTKLVFADGSRGRAENVKDVGQYIARIDEMIQRKKNALEHFTEGASETI